MLRLYNKKMLRNVKVESTPQSCGMIYLLSRVSGRTAPKLGVSTSHCRKFDSEKDVSSFGQMCRKLDQSHSGKFRSEKHVLKIERISQLYFEP